MPSARITSLHRLLPVMALLLSALGVVRLVAPGPVSGGSILPEACDSAGLSSAASLTAAQPAVERQRRPLPASRRMPAARRPVAVTPPCPDQRRGSAGGARAP